MQIVVAEPVREIHIGPGGLHAPPLLPQQNGPAVHQDLEPDAWDGFAGIAGTRIRTRQMLLVIHKAVQELDQALVQPLKDSLPGTQVHDQAESVFLHPCKVERRSDGGPQLPQQMGENSAAVDSSCPTGSCISG